MAKLWVPEDLFDNVTDQVERQQDQLQQQADANATIYDMGFDPRRFESRISRFYQIEDKQTRLMVPWGPLLSQRRAQKRLMRDILQALQKPGPVRMLVLKGRRVGSSTATILIMLELVMMLPWRAAIIAHSDESARTLLDIARRTFQRIPASEKPPLYKDNEMRLEWGEPRKFNRARGSIGHQASLAAYTAKGNYVLSAAGTSLLLLSEAAKYDTVGDLNAQMRFILSAIGSVPTVGPSLIVAETTANGPEGWYPETFKRAAERKPDATGTTWIPHFISYLDDESCAMAVPEKYNWNDWPKEDRPKEIYISNLQGCTKEHLYFRRWKIENDMNMDFQAFDQEFPATAGLAFISSGRRAIPAHYINQQLQFLQDPIARYECILAPGMRGPTQQGVQNA